MPRCELCGKEFKVLTKHLKSVHGWSKRKYKYHYPNALIIDPEVSQKMRDNVKPISLLALTPNKKKED